MKSIFTISIILGFLVIVLEPIGPYLEYALNRDFIVNNYCGNVERPEMKCNGSCYLMSRLQEKAPSPASSDAVELGSGIDILLLAPELDTWEAFAQLEHRITAPGSFLKSIWDDPPTAPPPRRVFS
ncbi:MAG: hypothetical protein AAGN35_17830 [Bacteroidota bacterium]